MNLVMFDMDGTLTDTFALDENCYVLAIEQTLGLTAVVTEWETYTHASSSFCLEEIVRRARGQSPTAAESRAVQSRMIELMEDVYHRHGRATAEIAGASACIEALQRAGHAVSIASGDWEATARHKLTSARIPFHLLPAAFCEASHIRTEIMRTSLARAASHHGRERFERIVYIGDGAWDVRACREIGWPLIGVGRDAHAHRLRTLGTSHVIPDFTELDAFIAALDQARVPAGQG
ncbi:MAG: Haloacid dehalogenase domain protein hydrolase [Verrucomicrobia bacterium]|nr:Haloacid dehalogenase domain protein hydrolase [Verrucomicrobiota bacterium]